MDEDLIEESGVAATAPELGGEFGYAGQSEAFARNLRDILDDDN